MQSLESKFPLIVILGPTAVGKTDISLELSESLNGEIISADSRLLYRGMDIGTAKPTLNERVRVPHHLIDVADPDQTWSLAMYQQEAHRIISDVQKRGRVPFLVGGTGQYIRAVTEEWEIPKAEPNHNMRQILEKWADEIGYEGLYSRLSIIDSEAANRIDPRNLRRTIRALEVIFLTGKRFSIQKKRGNSRYHQLKLGVTQPRFDLYNRIDERIENMLKDGWVEEVQSLLETGYSPGLPSLSAIGYQQIIGYLLGEIEFNEAIMLIKRYTRKYVRRQANWFKLTDPEIHWFQAGPNVMKNMEITIRKFISSLIIDSAI